MTEQEQNQLEPMSQNKRLLLIAMAIIGTILLPVFCILFTNSIIENFGILSDLNTVKSLSEMDSATLMIGTCGMITAIILTAITALMAWIVIFIEFGYNEKYANYLSVIPIIGGIICIIGMNGFPNGSLSGIVISAIGGTILLMGVAGKMGLFGKPPTVRQE
jgi:hypothetical protein